MINKHLLYVALVLWSVGMSQACRGISSGKNTDSIIHILDANFKRCLLENSDIDTNKDGKIQLSEAQNFQALSTL